MRQAHNARRSRGRSNRKHNVPLKHQNFESNGPDVRIRGNAHQVYEKYLAMARDANSSGDRISAEGYYQHAEHYFRIMNDSTDPQNAARQQQQQQRGRENGHDRQARDGEAAPAAEAQAAEPPRAEEPAAVRDTARDNAEVVEVPREAEAQPPAVNGGGAAASAEREQPKRKPARRAAKPKADEAEPAAEDQETPVPGA